MKLRPGDVPFGKGQHPRRGRPRIGQQRRRADNSFIPMLTLGIPPNAVMALIGLSSAVWAEAKYSGKLIASGGRRLCTREESAQAVADEARRVPANATIMGAVPLLTRALTRLMDRRPRSPSRSSRTPARACSRSLTRDGPMCRSADRRSVPSRISTTRSSSKTSTWPSLPAVASGSGLTVDHVAGSFRRPVGGVSGSYARQHIAFFE